MLRSRLRWECRSFCRRSSSSVASGHPGCSDSACPRSACASCGHENAHRGLSKLAEFSFEGSDCNCECCINSEQSNHKAHSERAVSRTASDRLNFIGVHDSISHKTSPKPKKLELFCGRLQHTFESHRVLCRVLQGKGVCACLLYIDSKILDVNRAYPQGLNVLRLSIPGAI